MQVNVERTDCTEYRTPLLAVNLFQGDREMVGPVSALDRKLGGAISSLLGNGDFRGKEGDAQVLYPRDGEVGAKRILLVGLGKREDLDVERMRRAAAVAVKAASRLRVSELASIMHHAEMVERRVTPERAARAVAEGAVLAGYRFSEMKSEPEDETERPVEVNSFTLLEKVGEKADRLAEGVAVGAAMARGANLTRTLGNLPGNVATPTYLAETAERIARETGMTTATLGRAELEKEGMKALLSVAQGSIQEPKLIVLKHEGGPKDQKPLVLVGKGLTFDAGGISIKPSSGMEEMKFDMSGGGAVLGAMQAIGELKVPANVIGVVPSSENLLSGAAMKPGDIIGSHAGKTIEIINTDAEGRLILADALSYVRRFEPRAVLDVATLTGGVVTALGKHALAVMGTDDALLEEVRAAGERAGERTWPLPLLQEYREQLDSDYADIKNSGGREASTISAGWFLRAFVGDYPWAHLDIAGVAYGDGKLPYQAKGATGIPTRLFVEWVLSRT